MHLHYFELKIENLLKQQILQHCSMRFADGSNLRRHIQTHTNEKPHVCKQCGKAFARGSILKEHMRTHIKVEDMECSGIVTTPNNMEIINPYAHQVRYLTRNHFKCFIRTLRSKYLTIN